MQRLRVGLVPLALGFAGVTAFHAADAKKRGEPVWPVVLGLLVAVLIVAGVLRFATRPVAGLEQAETMRARSRQILKWTAPAAAAIAIVVAIAELVLSAR